MASFFSLIHMLCLFLKKYNRPKRWERSILTIILYPTRVEIISPGVFPGFAKTADLDWINFSSHTFHMLNNGDVDNAIAQILFIISSVFHKFLQWTEPENINHYCTASNKTFYLPS